MTAPQNLTGQKFGQLTVLKALPRSLFPASKERKYRCQCDCGRKHDVRGSHLRSGNTKSCGCARRTPKVPRTPRAPTLAKQHPKEHETWRNMRKRCYQKNRPRYQIYGARGIAVCTSWISSFTTFLADMGPKPTPQHTIDRYPNNDGNYEPDNCRWATPGEQANNRRSNITLEYNGERKTLAEWARHLGLARDTIRGRLKRGWPIAHALLPYKQKIIPQILGLPPFSVQTTTISSANISSEFFQFKVVGW